ncbi:unnamed protein product, partial [Scytosiphon promiscuus]
MRDKNVHVSVIPGTDVAPPSLVFHKTGLASVEGVKATKAIPLIGETTVRPSTERNSRKRFTVEVRKKRYELQAPDIEARDAWVAAIRAVLSDASRTESDDEDDNAGAEDVSRNKNSAAGDATFDDGARGDILPEVSTTAPTLDGEASSIDKTKTEADAVVTLDMDPASSKKANKGQLSRQYEHVGCFKLFSFERPSAAMLPSEADLTPAVCIEACRREKAVLTLMMLGDVCMAV